MPADDGALAARLAAVAADRQLEAAVKTQASHPAGWEPGVAFDHASGTGTIVSAPSESRHADWDELLTSWGFDPAEYEIADDTVQIRTWEGYAKLKNAKGFEEIVKVPLWYHKATVRKRSGRASDEDLVRLVEEIKRWKPPKRTAPVGGDSGFIVNFSDWQLGKCLDGDSVVLRRDGTAVRLRNHEDAWSNGTQPVFRYKFDGGRDVIATASHPVMTRGGWRPIGDLELLDSVSCLAEWSAWSKPDRHQATVETGRWKNQRVVDERIDGDLAAFLGYFVTDGSWAQVTNREGNTVGSPQSPKFTSNSAGYLDEMERIASRWGCTPKKYPKGEGFDLIFTYGHQGVGGTLHWFLRSLDWDHGFPTDIFSWAPEHLGVFINRAWAGNGQVGVHSNVARVRAGARPQPQVGLACGNDQIFARYFQTLLLKLGVESRINDEHQAGGTGTFYRLMICPGADNIERFFDLVGDIKGKESGSHVVREHAAATTRRTHLERHFEEQDGEEMVWRKLRSVEPLGEREVFDVSYPGKRWFVANGVKVHNCDGDGIDGTLTRILNGFEAVRCRYRELRKIGRNLHTLYIADVGDGIENVCGNYPNQQATVQLNLRQQVTLMRRLEIEAIKMWAPDFERVVVLGVASNHTQPRQGGKQITDDSDDYGLAILESVHDALKENPAFEHVFFVIPQDEMVVQLDVHGTTIAWTHSHKAEKAGSGGLTLPQGKIRTWWQGQAFGGAPAGDADILVTGHFHHYSCIDHGSTGVGLGRRVHFQCPSSDGGSKWWSDSTGLQSGSGLLTFVAGHGAVTDVQIV